jgi:pimeloyl-ACP methyl ester carboxylesterase
MFWNAKYARVTIHDKQMEYISFGEGAKNLILLPGIGEATTSLKGMAKPTALAYKQYTKDFKVYLFFRINDLPEGYTTRDMALDQAEAMRVLGIDKASVLGVSQGGMIAQHLALCAPELVERLILTVTTAKSGEVTREVIGSWVTMAKQNDYRAMMMDMANRSYSESSLRKSRFLYAFLGRFGKPKDFRKFFIEARSCIEHDTLAQVGEIRCPTLIVGGEEDQFIPGECSRELAREIPHSELVLYPGLKHAAYEEAPDFHDTVIRFLTAGDLFR